MLHIHWTEIARDAIVEFRKIAKPSITSFLGALIHSTYVITAYSVTQKIQSKKSNYFALVNLFDGQIGIKDVGSVGDGFRIAFIEVRSFK